MARRWTPASLSRRRLRWRRKIQRVLRKVMLFYIIFLCVCVLASLKIGYT